MKKTYIYVIIAAVLSSAFLVIAGVLVGSKLIGNTAANQAVDVKAASNADSKIIAGGSNDSIAIPGFEKIVMKAGQTKQADKFYNPEANKCYFIISFALADGTELFRSGMIKPGKTIDTIEINRSLKAGTYKDAVLKYECYTIDGLKPLNGAETVINLEVIP
jgi:hypothetical protein